MKRKGFTLIELLIVITIIGILAVALLPKIVGVPAKGRDTQRIAHVNQFVTALETYYSGSGSYPISAGECLTEASGVGKQIASNFAQGKIPLDPTAGNKLVVGAVPCTSQYYYKSLKEDSSGTDGEGYIIVAGTEADGFTSNYYSTVDIAAKSDIEALSGLDLKSAPQATLTSDKNVYAVVYPL